MALIDNGHDSTAPAAASALVAHIIDDVKQAISSAPDVEAEVMRRLQRSLLGLRAGPTSTASPRPSTERWLAEAVSLAPAGRADMALAYQRAASHLHWNRSYPDVEPAPGFHDHYSYAGMAIPTDGFCAAGPLASVGGEPIALYLTIQGAGLVYPVHHHPAVEIYGVVSGTAQWLRGGEGFRPRRPGEVFVHQANEPHATTTLDEPMISWVAWLGDLTTSAALGATSQQP